MSSTRIIYTCPKCGADLEEIVLASLPAIYEKRCNNCGYSYREKEQIVRVPFVDIERTAIPTSTQLIYDKFNDPCANCSNKPKDGEIKACLCTLGLPKITC